MKTLFATLLACLLLTLPQLAHAEQRARLNNGENEIAYYAVTFKSSWSEQTHPGFPASAHYSPLIGAIHNSNATIWSSGALATPGIESMAETGSTSILRAEIAGLGNDIHELIAGPGLGSSPAQVTISYFSASRSHPLVTLVTMIAPSPDWFVGVHDLSLLDNQEEQWRDEIIVTLYPYDAGTDDGSDYTSTDVEPTQHQPISDIRGQAPFSDAPLGIFTFTRIHRVYLPLTSKMNSQP